VPVDDSWQVLAAGEKHLVIGCIADEEHAKRDWSLHVVLLQLFVILLHSLSSVTLNRQDARANDEFGMMNAEQGDVLLIIHHSAFNIPFSAPSASLRLGS